MAILWSKRAWTPIKIGSLGKNWQKVTHISKFPEEPIKVLVEHPKYILKIHILEEIPTCNSLSSPSYDHFMVPGPYKAIWGREVQNHKNDHISG